MTDIDELLHDYAARWQAIQPPPPPMRVPEPNSRFGWRLPPHPIRLAGLAAAVSVALIVTLVVVNRSPSSTQVSTNPTSAVAVAKAPLLRHSLPATGQINLTSGRAGAVAWTFYATSTSKKSALCLGVATQLANGSSCDNPRLMSSLTVAVQHLDGDPNVLLVTGVTSAPAASFNVAIGAHTTPASAQSSVHLPGLIFFALQIPTSEYVANGQVLVEALSANGSVLLRNDPKQVPPLVPVVQSPGAATGPQVVWPIPGTHIIGLSSPTAVAAAFATQALGIQHPSVSANSAAAAGGITSVTIVLPATGKDLNAIAEHQANGTWALLQVGDQSLMRGVTVLPAGQPGAVMSLLPPRDAAQADITEVASDGSHRIHLDSRELATDTAHLEGTSIEIVLIVYRDAAGEAVSALGESFA